MHNLGVERVKSENGIFFIATPLRAVMDYVYAYRKHWRGLDPLIKSLRIEPHTINQWDYSLLDELKEVYPNYRVQRFIKGLKKDLNL